MLSYIKPDAVLITETKLNSEINTADVPPGDLGYTVYRKDRRNEGGGGVALLFKSCYSSTKVSPLMKPLLAMRTYGFKWNYNLHGHRELLLSSFYCCPIVCFTSLMASLIKSVGGLSKYFYQGLGLADLNAGMIGQSINRRGVA